MQRQVEQFNYLAIELLEKLGNSEPTEFQIEIIESILSQLVSRWKISTLRLTLSEIISILLSAKGKKSTEIADLLSISQLNIEERNEGVKNKLNFSVLA